MPQLHKILFNNFMGIFFLMKPGKEEQVVHPIQFNNSVSWTSFEGDC